MTPMALTPAQINRGLTQFINDVVQKVDTNRSKMISGKEIVDYKGPGKALLEKTFRYAAGIDATRDIRMSLIDTQTFEKGAKKIADELKKIARSQGDKDGKLEGTARELGTASDAAASLARWIQANAK